MLIAEKLANLRKKYKFSIALHREMWYDSKVAGFTPGKICKWQSSAALNVYAARML
jgi:hypothetical protein